MLPFNKDLRNKSSLSTRWAQMTKQEQIIEKKKMEIQAKLEAQKQAAALAAQAKLAQLGKQEDNSSNIFSNDGSFMNHFKTLLEKQNQEKEEKQKLERGNEQPSEEESQCDRQDTTQERTEEHVGRDDGHRGRSGNRDGGRHHHRDDRRRSDDGGHRDRRRRWSDRGHHRGHSPGASNMDERMQQENKNIPSLMQIPIMHPDNRDNSNNESEQPINPWNIPPGPPGYNMGDQGNNQNMTSAPNMGPPNMGPGSNNMGHNQNNMGPGPINMSSGPNNMGQNMAPRPNMGMGQMMGPGGHNMPPLPPGGPMPPFMGGPPNFGMPPFMGPNGRPNMCGPNGPNGPMPPYYGPPFPNGPMMRPGAPPPPPPSGMPPHSMSNNMPFMGQGPFGPNRPMFDGRNGPPPNMSFMPPNMPPPNSMNSMSDSNDSQNRQDNMNHHNIPPPMPQMSMNQIPQPSDMEPGNIPLPPSSSQVLSPGVSPAAARAAADVARNGDHWENVLKATQDQNMWFLHNQNSSEYKAFRDLVNKFRAEDKKPEVKPEDKYEPEFSLEDEDSNDGEKYNVKEENSRDSQAAPPQYPWTVKRESSQSDEEREVKRERRKRKKSRWGDDPAELPLPTVPDTPPAPPLPGAKLAKIDEEGLKLTTVNRNNQALMQYAMTNYGTTNLSAEDWKKCEDNFKLNLLYQDMLKKRNEVERLAAAGKHKYEYDSDEDTAEGTWEHKLRTREMSATEKWADELTKQAAGKHHIGDFLPPEELKKFMEKYSAAKMGKEPDLSDYKEFKLKEDNLGFKMLQKLGWSEGQGLGAEGTGIVDPINKSNQPGSNLGLGAATGDAVSPDDDEFDAYRKRMMLAYRFRPNPLNNPRRPYY
ncbi:SURP and G-patch domain-containing protein 1 isoform X2 [Plutella xylostella]|uniref:SURP and G-patch domain-containing protein 1 isoform X2 n=1 Tax=Plutella xylostella TaxID=51655 RepID=UPI002032B7A7|nr:SURP and G-patch domain-containing protein 1 isoform X2 [Plutella xylostella]